MEVVATNVERSPAPDAFGSGLDALPGEFPPLYEGDVGVAYVPDPKANGVVSNFELVVLNPSATLIDWDSQKAKPPPADHAGGCLGRHLGELPAGAGEHDWRTCTRLLQNDARQLA